VRTAAGDLKAFSATCTHLDCTVQYKNDQGILWCACHNGKYDLNGRNISGPPPRPLDSFRVVVQGEEVLVSKMHKNRMNIIKNIYHWIDERVKLESRKFLGKKYVPVHQIPYGITLAE
jgi:hypothetical protein